MIPKILLIPLFSSALAAALSQSVQPGAGTVADYSIIERGGHYNIWQSGTNGAGPSGHAHPKLHQYTELGTGLNHLVANQWRTSSSQITPTSTGAELTNAQYSVVFSGDINTAGAVDLTMPDSQHLTCNVLGLNYFDTASGQSVLFAEITNSAGVLPQSGTQALYPLAFTGVQADVLYTCSISGVESFIVLREQPPSPAQWGLDPETTLLEAWTEFINPPGPVITPIETASGQDQFLAFGPMHMGPGEAFAIGSNTNKVPVTKQWVVTEGRSVLVEQVPLTALDPLLETLPVYSGQSASLPPGSGTLIAAVAEGRSFPRRNLTRRPKLAFKVAGLPPRRRAGVAIDWNSTLSGNQTNMVFQMDGTYYISGLVDLYGSNTFEGGTVIKYATNAYMTLEPSSTFSFLGSMFRPIVFTAKDDNSIGDPISGSTGAPTNFYANPALNLIGLSGLTLKAVRFTYAAQAIEFVGSSATIYDGQFVNCQQAFTGGGANIHVRNALFANTLTSFGASAASSTAENVTFSGGAYLATASSGSSTLALTNCCLVNVTNLTNTSGSYSVTLTGDWNGFYNTTTFGNDIAPAVSSSPFQAVGAGGCYLADGSPWRNAGTTNIDPALLADLQTKTTYPPVVVSNLTYAVPIILSPQVQRDTDTPDIGYNYDPIDYALCNVTITNVLTIEPGTVIAMFDIGGAQGGITLRGTAQFSSGGLATAHNWIVEYNMVQEQPGTAWAAPNWQNGYFAMIQDPDAIAPTVNCRFTDWSSPAQDIYHQYINYAAVTMQDCQVHGGLFVQTASAPVTLTNNLFERPWFYLEPGGAGGTAGVPLLRNNLFFGGIFEMDPSFQTNALVKDNLFDRTTIEFDADGWAYNGGYNAFVTNYSRLEPTNVNDVILTHPIVYQVGPLGNYYQPSNSPLINIGSTNATLVALYHYTVMTNLVSGLEIKETNSIVDIGVHYVAVDSSGNPIDTNGDGVPDYIEDANGNGTVDSGEIGWNITGDLGLSVLITHPRNGSTIP